MKRIISLLCAIIMLFSLAATVYADNGNAAQALESKRDFLFVTIVITAVAILASISFTIIDVARSKLTAITISCYFAAVVTIVCCFICFFNFKEVSERAQASLKSAQIETTATSPTNNNAQTEPTTAAPEESQPEVVPPVEEPETPAPTLSPTRTESSDPANWNIKWELLVGNQVVDSFEREETIDFGDGNDYYPLEGVATFRGNNYRNSATYGTTEITHETLDAIWSKSVGALGGWPGVGWTGQPLVVKWDNETKQIMNLYDSKKTKDNLVEVICTTLDGYIYFLDLEDGSYTRDPMWIGMSIKGTGALDPRGYPLMFAGSGLMDQGTPSIYAISLIDTTILWQQGGNDGMNPRYWCGFDGSPIISGEADTLIWGGENGLLYTIKLNTVYDPTAGTISVAPENVIRTRYSSMYSGSRYVGYESSIVTVGQYGFIGDNGGFLFCVDLMTMELVWAQFTGDDINATPVFEWGDDGNGYLYTATSADYGGGVCNMHKINANTGEIVWEKTYTGVVINKDASRGVLSSPVLGQPGTNLEGLIIHTISGTPTGSSGILFALNTETGEIVYEKNMSYYAWSSPVAMYNNEGKGYLALGDAVGSMMLIDGATGEVLATEDLGSNMEASPVVYENTLVIGTRGQRIYGVKIQ